MRYRKQKLVLLVALLEGIIFFHAYTTFALDSGIATSTQSLDRQTLEAQIQAKAKDLEVVTKQLTQTNENLKTVKNQKVTLQHDLQTMKSTISQLSLRIKADTLNIQKLGLELETLHYDTQDIEKAMKTKRLAVGELLGELQKKDNENLLAVFLRNNTLADSVFETQSLTNIQSQLTGDIQNLITLHAEYNQKITLESSKKQDIALHQKELQDHQVIIQDQKQEQESLLAATKNKESVYQQQLGELLKQQQKIESEIEDLDAILRAKINPSSLPFARSGVLFVPVEGGAVTQGYGSTSFAASQYRSKWHNGIDIGAPIGTPVYAAEDGTVAAVGNEDLYCPRAAYGRFIVINHNNNLTTLYGHLSRQIVIAGDTVKRGQLIGYVGKTGWATGPHLHFTVFAQATYYLRSSRSCGPIPQGGDLNPLTYL